MRTKRERHRGLGQYQIDRRMDTEYRILNCLWEFSNRFGMWITLRGLHRETKVEMKTLRKTLDRLIKQERIKEYRGLRNSKLFCILGTKDNIDYHSMMREFTDDFLTIKEAEATLAKIFTKNKDGLMIRK